MAITAALNWGVSCLGQTFQEVSDIYTNGRALYKHGDLSTLRGKVLPTAECQTALQVQHMTHRSNLFLFRDYTFQIQPQGPGHVVVEIFPAAENPSSLTKIFAQESLRRAVKGVAVVGVAVLTAPAWALAFAGASRCCKDSVCGPLAESWNRGAETARTASSRLNLALPPEPADSHITPNDILKIGPALIGYRHVSTEELAQDNARNGFRQGCSLNISFCKCESSYDNAKFENLDLRVASGEDVAALIGEYEAAITQFIRNSILMDREELFATYGDLFATLDQTRFMIIKTGWHKAADVSGYGGLGRLPKENVGPEGVTLLRRIGREELAFCRKPDRERITCPQELEALVSHTASHYRRELLRYLREDFDPRQFGQTFRFERRRIA